MRCRLLLPLLAAVGCSDPVTCENLNARQSADVFRTCVSSATLDDEPVTISLADGTPLTVDRLPPLNQDTFDDGVRLFHYQGHLDWTRDRETFRRDSVGDLAGSVRVHPGGRYAVPLPDGRLLLRSRDGPDPVDIPIDIEWMEIGDYRGALSIYTAFSGDGRRVAAVDGGRTAFVVDARSGDRLWQTALDTTARAVALSPDGGRVAVAQHDRTVRVWEVGDGAEVGRWDHPRTLYDVAFGTDGSLIVWLDEKSVITRQNTTGSGNLTSHVRTSTTPPAVIVWRMP